MHGIPTRKIAKGAFSASRKAVLHIFPSQPRQPQLGNRRPPNPVSLGPSGGSLPGTKEVSELTSS